MHPEADQWVAQFATHEPLRILDIGGRNINGSNRKHFPGATYTTLDIRPGDGVDIVADAATWVPDTTYDRVVCTEVFEHTAVWPQICRTAYDALRSGGDLILTMAGPGRAAHSAEDGGLLRPGEYYGNVDPDELRTVLTGLGFAAKIDVNHVSCDVRAYAVRL